MLEANFSSNYTNEVQNASSNECFSLEESPRWLIGVQATVLSCVFVSSLVGNILIILMVLKYKKLQCHSVVASLNIVVSNLIWSFSHHLPALINLCLRRWVFSSYGCLIIGYLRVELQITRWLLMGVLAFDRFCTVRFPFRYEKRKKSFLMILILVAWITPLLLCIPLSVPNFEGVSFNSVVEVCNLHCLQDKYQPCRIYFTLLFALSLLIGGVVPTLVYIWLYRRARRLRSTAIHVGRMVVQIATGIVVHQPIVEQQNSLRKRAAREWRSICTFSIIFVTVFATGLVYFTFEFVRAVSSETWCDLPLAVKFVVLDFSSSTVALDPILIMRDSDFRWCLKDFFCCRSDIVSEDVEAQLHTHRTSVISIGSLGKSRMPGSRRGSSAFLQPKQDKGSASSSEISNNNIMLSNIPEIQDPSAVSETQR